MNTEKDKPPYVGPRTFEADERDRFFGREREARDLFARVVSERLVLFYAQSGAGKSSLLNTCLRPDLAAKNFAVFTTGRVVGDVPPRTEVKNIFVYNLMQSLTKSQVTTDALAKLSISEIIAKLKNDFPPAAKMEDEDEAATPHVLIIDQFEELFSTHPEAWAKREDFFQQLADAMENDPYLWVVLVMREDYIASLDPYAHLFPNRLSRRYYMQRLEREAAIKAVKGPVEKLRPFAAGVAEKLVDDLSSIKVKRQDGTIGIQPGQYVEPVQLQVVCQNLWEKLPESGNQITIQNLDELGNVNEALENYYGDRIKAATSDHISEREIREWFQNELITSGNTRNIVPDDSIQSDRFKAVVQILEGNLIRAEPRAGQNWYELSHDRLIEPVRKNNAAWFEKNLSLFQRQVVLWTQQNRSDSLLLKGRELLDAEREAETLALTTEEQDFLKESRLLRRREQLSRIFVIALTVLLALAVISTLFAFRQRNSAIIQTTRAVNSQETAQAASTLAVQQQMIAENSQATAQASEQEAKKQANKALAGSLAAQAESVKVNNHALALLLGVEAYQGEDNLLTRTTLFQLLQFTPYTRLFGYKGPVTNVAVSPNGKVIASAGCQEYDNNQCAHGEIILSDALKHQPIGNNLSGDFGIMNSLAFNRDGSILAAGGCVPVDQDDKGCKDSNAQILLWDVSDPASPAPLSDIDIGDLHNGPIKSIAFSPDGVLLASGGFDKRIVLWNVSDPMNPSFEGIPLLGHSSFVNGLAFSPDGNTLVSAGDDRTILLWNISRPKSVSLIGDPIEAHRAPVNSIAFSPDGKKFASASSDNTVLLWEWSPGSLQDPITPSSLENPIPLEGHTGYVTSVAFNADGSALASAGFDNQVILWNTTTAGQIGPTLSAHTRPINTIVFGTAETQDILFSGSNDRTVILWDLSTRRPLSQPEKESAEEAEQIAQSGNLKATVDGQNINLQAGSGSTKTLTGHTGAVNSLNFSLGPINGKLLLASASDDQTVILWDVSNFSAADVFLKLEGFGSPVISASFREDGKLITVEKNGPITQWIIDPADWKSLACEAANRKLTGPEADPKTAAEWEQIMQDEPYPCESIP